MLNDDIDDKVLSEEALKIIQEIMIDGGFTQRKMGFSLNKFLLNALQCDC